MDVGQQKAWRQSKYGPPPGGGPKPKPDESDEVCEEPDETSEPEGNPDTAPNAEPAHEYEGKDPAETIAALTAALANNQSEIADLTEAGKTLQTDLGTLSQAWEDAEQLIEAYGNSQQALQDARQESEEYYEKKQSMICAVVENKDELDALIDGIHAEIADIAGQIETAWAARAEAERLLEVATNEQETAQEAYDYATGYHQRIAGWLQELDALETAIEAADEGCDHAAMYALIREYEDILGQIEIKSAEAYRQYLIETWCALNAAKEARRERQAALDDAEDTLTQLEEQHAELVKTRRARILAAVAEFG